MAMLTMFGTSAVIDTELTGVTGPFDGVINCDVQNRMGLGGSE